MVRKLGLDGTITTIYALPEGGPDRRVYDFAITQDATTLYVTGANVSSSGAPRDGYVTRLSLSDLAETPIITPEGSKNQTHVIALDGQDRLHVMSQGGLRRWDATQGFSTVASSPLLDTTLNWSALARAGFDARDNFWWFSGTTANQLNRLVGTQVETVAGSNGKLLTGDGVDDSLLNGMSPVFTANGDVLFCDYGHNQVKRLAGTAR
jgi:hypothetical protein